MVAVMRALGHERFAVAGHDRGGRVAHRMALDHPDAVERAAVLDIVPTRTLFARSDQAFATAYYHWFFLIQPGGLPETMIGADPEWFLRETLRRWSGRAEPLAEEAIAEYARCFRDPAAIHASCEDYRAAATIDLAHDADDGDGASTCPLLVLWGEHGAMHRLYDVLDTWRAAGRRRARPRRCPCGHFLPEEAPGRDRGRPRGVLRDLATGRSPSAAARAAGSWRPAGWSCRCPRGSERTAWRAPWATGFAAACASAAPPRRRSPAGCTSR